MLLSIIAKKYGITTRKKLDENGIFPYTNLVVHVKIINIFYLKEKPMKKIILTIISCSSCMFSYADMSSTNTKDITNKELTYNHNKLSLTASIGHLEGKSEEFVYDDGQKLSQLDWEIQQASIIRGGISYNFSSSITALASGWAILSRGNAVMDDYDWLNPFQSSPSEWSHHDNTQLRDANNIDLNLRK
jgi:outer membrane protease